MCPHWNISNTAQDITVVCVKFSVCIRRKYQIINGSSHDTNSRSKYDATKQNLVHILYTDITPEGRLVEATAILWQQQITILLCNCFAHNNENHAPPSDIV